MVSAEFSEKKESAGTREEKINSISGVSYRAQWATHNFSCLRQEEMDGDPPPALGGVRMWVRNRLHCLLFSLFSSAESISVGKIIISTRYVYIHLYGCLATPGHKEKVLVQVEQGREPQLALGLQGAASDKPEKSKSEYPSCLVGDHPDADQEERSRWVKRLKVVRSGGHSGASALAGRREQRLCSRVMNYSRSNPFTLAKCLREQRQFQKTMLLLRSSDSLAAPPVDSHPWIRRWSRKSRLTPPPPGQEVERVEPLAAMALMGKAINNFRPCKFQRRGSSLVWNTEGL
ncbi:unnamed protein product [Spirodela intermedia]|uniref:Uncharacterized protein n=1 Tax=Spirodela intermedia TaxID=51605 RepID=A0A7I8J4U0_SPIIN|nr:unnamed protein product [Spirodela intermedia]CAA6665247.1 unnamed protein product [Spirodela intermedia]